MNPSNDSHNQRCDNMEVLLGGLTPQKIQPDLRPQVLAAVANRLQEDRESRRLRWAAWMVAASILFGFVLNFATSWRSERRLAQIYGPPPVSNQAFEIAQFIEKVTDPQTSKWICQQYTFSPPACDGQAAYKKYNETLQQFIHESTMVLKDSSHETSKEDSEMDRDRAGRSDRDPLGCQRRVRVDHRFTA
jgi:hypothetical protein